MPINHSRRLSQPKTKTVIDPVTNKKVFYTDYLKMEEERAKASNDNVSQNSDHDSQATDKQTNSKSAQPDGWSEHESLPDSHNEEDDEDPNAESTNDVLLLRQKDLSDDNDTSMQSKLRKALNQPSHTKQKQIFQAKAALRNERLAQAQKQRNNSKKKSAPLTASTSTSKRTSIKKTTKSNKPKTSTNTSKKSNNKSKVVVVEDSSDSSSAEDSKSTSTSSSTSSDGSVSSSSSTTSSSSSDSETSIKSNSKKSSKKKKNASKSVSSTSKNYYQPIVDEKTNKRRISKAERRSAKKIQRKYRTFFTLKIRINNNEDAVKELFSQTKKWFDKLQQVDKRGIVYAYQDKTPSSALMTSSELPDDYAVYKNFFQGTKTQEEAGWTWATIWLGHDTPVASLLDSMGKWSRKTMTWMFAKHLQEKDTVKEYFLLWSTSILDTTALHKVVMDVIDRNPDGREYKFAFAWNAVKGEDNAIVRRPKAFKGEKDSDRIVRALHIEVPRSKKDYIYRRLQLIFGINNRTRILGRRLLMVPIIKPTTPTHKIVKIKHLIDKHMKYQMNLKTAKVWDFTEVDYKHPILNLSVRDMIMDIPPLDGSDAPVFLGIDYNKRDECYEVTFPKYMDTQVRDIIAQLPSIIAHIYTDVALELLTPSAQERAVDAPWDENEMCAISKEDREMEKMLRESKKMGLDSDSDSDSSLPNLNFQFEDQAKLAKSRRLFKKTSTNESITSLNTFEDIENTAKNSRDDSTIITDNPSPPKKSKTTTAPDDVSALGDGNMSHASSRLNAVESSVSHLSNMLGAFLKSQNFQYTPQHLDHDMEDAASHDDNSQKNRESSEIVSETPGILEVPGDIL